MSRFPQCESIREMADAEPNRQLTRQEVLAMTPVTPDVVLRYGPADEQVVDRFDAAEPGGVGVLLFHGGCWRHAVDRQHASPLASALARHGFTTWSGEYRRLGGGGGFPETFTDVADAAELVWSDAPTVGVDPRRIVIVGHSAGGQLALWVAAERRRTGAPPRGVVALAAVCDLSASVAEGMCDGDAAAFLDGTPERLALVSPAHRLPTGVPHRHIVGVNDTVVPPEHIERFVRRARDAGDDVGVTAIPGGHFEPIASAGDPLAALIAQISQLAGTGPDG